MPLIIIEIDREKDLPAVAEINRRTFLQELPSHFAYKPSADNGGQLVGFFQDRLVGRLSQPQARLFKAIDQDTGQIHGFACWRRVKKDGNEPAAAPAPTALPQLPPFMNAEFTATTGAEVKQLEDHMIGEHYYLTAFAVDPDHQNKGIGAQLLNLYLRHGFVDVDYKDNDLNAWDNNRRRGYGIYRAYAMVRHSQVKS